MSKRSARLLEKSQLSSKNTSDKKAKTAKESELEFEEVDFEKAFFYGSGVPDGFQNETDILFLNPLATTDNTVATEKDKAKMPFTANITSFEDGTTLTKHCAPFGDYSWLWEREFILVKKIFRSTGEIHSVIVKSHSYKGNQDYELSLEPAFFSGWLDENRRIAFYDATWQNPYSVRKSTK